MGKTNKSFSKRISVTGTGKIMKRPPGQNHFNARANGQQTRNKKGSIEGPKELIKKYKALIFN